jgi:hypothetical protein
MTTLSIVHRILHEAFNKKYKDKKVRTASVDDEFVKLAGKNEAVELFLKMIEEK